MQAATSYTEIDSINAVRIYTQGMDGYAFASGIPPVEFPIELGGSTDASLTGSL